MYGDSPWPNGTERYLAHSQEDVGRKLVIRTGPKALVQVTVERGFVRLVQAGYKLPVIYAGRFAGREVKLFREIDGSLNQLPLILGEEAIRHTQSKLHKIPDSYKVVKQSIPPVEVKRGPILIYVRNILVRRQK